MRVLIVASYNHGRIAPFVTEQAEAIKQQGCEVLYFRITGHGASGYLRNIRSLRKTIRDVQPDLIHAHYGLSALLANIATRTIPVVSTYHGSDINNPKAFRFSKWAIRLSEWNIFVSRQTMAIAHCKEGERCGLIPCGVELSDEQLMSKSEARSRLGWGSNEHKILFAGAFDNNVKDPELAKQAISELNRRGTITELVELKGYTRQEVNRMMCGADGLLLTSKTEGSPQVIKEAMACGCPIVSVDVGDIKERTEGGNGCYIIPKNDRLTMIAELANAIEKAIAFKGKTSGREKIIADGLSNELIAERLVQIYRKVLIQSYKYGN